MEKEGKSILAMLSAPVLMALLAAALYALGIGFHNGRMRGFGLSPGLFLLEFNETLYYGFVAAILLLIRIIRNLLLQWEFWAVLIGGGFILGLVKRGDEKRKSAPQSHTLLQKCAALLPFIFEKSVLLIGVILIFIYLGLVFGLGPEIEGGESAETMRRDFLNGKVEHLNFRIELKKEQPIKERVSDCVSEPPKPSNAKPTLESKQQPELASDLKHSHISGYMIRCSPVWCAFFSQGKTILLPTEQINAMYQMKKANSDTASHIGVPGSAT